MSHAALVDRAVGWLRDQQQCTVVITTNTAGRGRTREIPDAIGWRGASSYLVECKSHRRDFLVDLRKPSRQLAGGWPARECYYLTPPGLVYERDLPPLWGLLWAERFSVRVVAPGGHAVDPRTPADLRLEIERLVEYVTLIRESQQARA
jgi:hypothetical protein